MQYCSFGCFVVFDALDKQHDRMVRLSENKYYNRKPKINKQLSTTNDYTRVTKFAMPVNFSPVERRKHIYSFSVFATHNIALNMYFFVMLYLEMPYSAICQLKIFTFYDRKRMNHLNKQSHILQWPQLPQSRAVN